MISGQVLPPRVSVATPVADLRQGVGAVVVALLLMLVVFQRQRAGDAVAELVRVSDDEAAAGRVPPTPRTVAAPLGGVDPRIVEERRTGAADREAAPLDHAGVDVDLAGRRRDVVGGGQFRATTEKVRNVPNDVCVRVSTLV